MVKSAQFIYQSSYSNILQQFWNLFYTWKKEILNFENWIKIDRERSLSFRWKMGGRIFTKQNAVLKQINSYACCLMVASKPQNLRKALPTSQRRALIAPKWGLVGLVTQTNWIDVKTVFILIVFKIYRTSKSNNLSLTTIT